MEEQQLQDIFSSWNTEKFGGLLPNYKIKFRKMRSFGRVNFNTKIISLNPMRQETIMNTLLHEMVHADLHRRKCKNTSHSVRFWRMFADKGGIITETNKKLFKKANAVAYERNIKQVEVSN